MSTCPSCSRRLDDGLLCLDAPGKATKDQSKAAWKSCPRCSKVAGVHVYLPMADFGSHVKQRRTAQNPLGLQSDCTFHRNNDNRDIARPSSEQRTCGAAPATTTNGARPPTHHRAPPTQGRTPESPDDVRLSADQLDALVLAQVGWLELSEEGRKVMRTHFETERKPGNRRAILRLRLARGPLTCDACQVDLAKLYGKDHASVVELHHVQPLSRGVQRPTGTDAFALLCPTCHRVVHYRREDPLTLEEVRRLLKPCAQDPGPR